MRHYCTFFDRLYLVQGLTLYRSLSAVSPDPFVLWVLCLDDRSFEVVSRLKLPNLRPVPLGDLEAGDARLQEAKRNRSLVEFYFTCSPSWPHYLLRRVPEMGQVTYLDADLMFHGNPEPIFEEMDARSVLIVGHRFPERLRYMEIHGIYNVGLVSFRNDGSGRECLEWWRERCLEWCYDRVEDGRFADQKYLDDWPRRFRGVAVLAHPGAGLAPWNWMNHDIRAGTGGVTVDGRPLIFYHYQGFKVINRWLYDQGHHGYGNMAPRLRRLLYGPYVKAVKESERWLKGEVPGVVVEYPRARLKKYGWGELLGRFGRGQIMLDPT